MNIDFAKLCGKHGAIYEAYYKQMDPKGAGTIEAMAAAKFLKKSGLSDVVLSRVWDLSDPNGKGYLDRPGFYVALKLVSLAQHGHVYNMNNIYMDTERPPKVGDIPKIVPPRVPPAPVAAAGMATGDWSIGVIDRLKYEQLFESLKPVGGMLPGNKVKGVLLESKLPMETLGKIWDLADQDKDGNLDKHEFLVAMHLVYKTLEKRTVPDILPVELRKPGLGGPPNKPGPPAMPPPPVGAAVPRAPSNEGFGDGGFVANFPKDIAPPPAIPLPVTVPPPMQRVPPVGGPATVAPLISTDPLIPIGAPPSVTANADWVVTPDDMKRFEVMFREADRDKDGLVSGLEVKNVFLQSGVPQKMLAHIWALCDTNQSGKLTLEQFALAMWMVERKQKGIDPPQVLTANMVPPSMRGIVTGVDVQESKPTYTNPELEMISKEIEELAKERRALETEIAQKEADIRIKNGEVRSLQSELDTLSATLKQLENQRGEAQKRLDDLKAQVNKIREQCQKQEDTINEQEGELNAKRSELQKLKDEENSLQKEYDENNRELQKLTNHLQNTQLQISSIRSMVTQLMETQRQMTDALLLCRAAIEAENTELVSEYQLKIEPDLDEARKTLEKEIGINDDPFNDNKTALNKNNGFTTNGFESDPFVGNTTKTITTAKGGFDDSFNTGFDAGFDAFSSSNTTSGFGETQKDPFGGDAFANKPEPVKDTFDSDPFASLHAPTGQGQVLSPNTQTASSIGSSNKSGPPPRPESPSPALPPKKSKVPPPRPAPPRPIQAPNRPAQPDAFGSSSNPGGFADFADFDNKAPTLPPPFAPTIPTKTQTQNNFIKLKNTTTLATTVTPPSSSTTSSIASLSTTNLSLFDNFTLTPPIPAAIATASNQTSTSLFGSNTALNKDALTELYSKTNASISTTTTVDNITAITNTSSTTNINNHLTRSTTPLQLAAITTTKTTTPSTSSVFDAFGTITTTSSTATAATSTTKKTDHFSTIKSTSSIISGPTDFKDDPFKDYRYEDPFNIKDPFDDDDDEFPTDPDKVFKDDVIVASDDEKLKIGLNNDNNNFALDSFQANTTNSSSASNAFSTAKSHSTVSSEFLNQFDSFTLQSNPSPVPSQHSSTSSAFMGASATDIKDAGATKSKSNTPLPLNNTKAGVTTSSSLFDNFADFDTFSTKSATSTMESNKKLNVTKADPFFDAFNDNFETTSNKSLDSNSNQLKTNTKSLTSLDAFDAFGNNVADKNVTAFDAFGDNLKTAAVPQQVSAMFDAFNDNNFEDDFFKSSNLAKGTSNTTSLKETNLNNNNSKLNKSPLPFNDNDFGKFDAFAALNEDDFNNTSTSSSNLNNSIAKPKYSLTKTDNLIKVQNKLTVDNNDNNDKTAASNPENGAKLPDKFVADYSKPETFDDDMEEAIKRSMVDQ
ncbi:epidermal growth factor receptor substrate 15-like 1 isoform X2 [Calliphora vicina]|uniref:epidermal growth factor receptor substrate 15-like 1 isoform X2 n=1 Tax=Calliphora vicina TaxID=7373 RepID=UPI00325BC79E